MVLTSWNWNHNTEIRLVRNDLYKGNMKPKNDGVTFKIYTKVDAAYADVQGGNLDVLDTVPTADVKNFQTDTNLQSYNQPGSVIQMFTIPSNLPHFISGTQESTLRRQAISKAIDRQGITSRRFLMTPAPSRLISRRPRPQDSQRTSTAKTT